MRDRLLALSSIVTGRTVGVRATAVKWKHMGGLGDQGKRVSVRAAVRGGAHFFAYVIF